MILLIDNYDSFTFNLAQYIGMKSDLVVVRNDHKDLDTYLERASALVFSPGPGWPKDAGRMEEIIEQMAGRVPILGICLGFQAIVEVFGGKLRLAKKVRHGKESLIEHKGQETRLFKGMDNLVPVMRYHSLAMDQSKELVGFEITAKSCDDQEIMAIENDDLKVYGLQFHPESIGSPDGMKMIENFLEVVKNG
ncbi:aminodeoxychorismate/anthranilate synthase component II [Streptococcaceae bacterium ESL0687]|nr:aminodeoxychorismate/anthranilate synthase component II [Streptococcaceae bacterium ESL0687]